MTKTARVLTRWLALCALPALPVLAAAAAPFTIDDLVRLKRLSDPQVSPDGTQLVYVQRETDMDADKGRTSWARPEKSTRVPNSLPAVRRTTMPAASPASSAASRSAVLPTPGSPVNRSVPPSAAALERNEAMSVSSRSRPTRGVARSRSDMGTS